MLKVRFNIETRLLSGWTDKEEEFDDLEAREGEDTTLLDIPKPDVDDYEYFLYKGGTLEDNPDKQPHPYADPRDLFAEIDEMKADIEKLKEPKP